ncbi:MAG: cellulase family glycosylhydrolase [Gemmatales bacterium]|nr:cellulase family glycosylhydrolase [Gemmatales bacterium]MDW7995556.1 cellulase family glycosylhydrolase [Gemmatales bacterium]
MLNIASIVVVVGLLVPEGAAHPQASKNKPPHLERIVTTKDGTGFSLSPSGRRFIPWGFNYDHDEEGRLIEDYWDSEWDKITQDFREMKQLGANVVRIHLQLSRFLPVPDVPSGKALLKLRQLLDLAAETGLYVDLTGLGCYHRREVPAWYDALDEGQRWEIQVRFWEAVARCCAGHPALWCYDLMNEPVIPGGKVRGKNWLGPEFGGKCFVQFITLDARGRRREEIGEQWVRTLVSAIRRHDPHTLITVGLLDGNIERRKFHSGFDPRSLASYLDFLSLHIYPKSGEIEEAVKRLEEYAVGKPIVIEEMFPLHCQASELEQFIVQSQRYASGWIGFYWGKTPAELQRSHELTDKFTLAWLELFQKLGNSLGK